MIEEIKLQFKENIELHQRLIDEISPQIEKAGQLIIEAYKKGNKLLLCGNGGSAADAQHIAAELVGRFKKERSALPAISLTTDTSILTALSNDYSYETVFSRQIEALGRPGDLLIAISTSGNSGNVINALSAAKAKNIKTIALLGGNGGKMKDLASLSIIVPSQNTARVQESHILIGHIICGLVESNLFKA